MLRLFRFMFLLLPLLAAAPAQAQTAASSVVRDFYSQLQSAMKQGPQLGFDGRVKALAPAVRGAFNLPLMAKMSVGANWATANAKEQSDLVEAFSAFSIATYASRFASDEGLAFNVVGEKPMPTGTIVETKLLPKDGEAVTLNYLMRPDEQGKMRIVDVFMNGTISELATRRVEYSAIARKDGVPALTKALEQKATSMNPGV